MESLFTLEFNNLDTEPLPKEVQERLINYCRDYFTNSLFLKKHLPNGTSGQLVNSAVSVLADLRAYLYIASDPISEEFGIQALAFGRDEVTGKLSRIKIFVFKMEDVHFSHEDDLEEEEEEERVFTGFQDLKGTDIMSYDIVKYMGHMFQVIINPYTKEWVLDNTEGQVPLLSVYKEVELVVPDEG